MIISDKENIKLSMDDYYEIIDKSDNKITHAIWLLELKKYNIDYSENWNSLIDNIVYMILNKKNYNSKSFLRVIKKIREHYYNLFITNIPTQTIIRLIMKKLLKNIIELKLKIEVIEITSMFELRLSQGTRHIMHFEAYIIKLFHIFNIHNNNQSL